MQAPRSGATVKEYRIRCHSYVLHLKWLSDLSAGKSLICPCNHANLHYPSCPAAALVTHLCMFSSDLIAHIMLDCLKRTICGVFFTTASGEYPPVVLRFRQLDGLPWKGVRKSHDPQKMNPNDFVELTRFLSCTGNVTCPILQFMTYGLKGQVHPKIKKDCGWVGCCLLVSFGLCADIR